MRAGRLSESPGRAARRSVRVRVCCAPFPLLRPLTLHCTRRRGAAEGEGAQQTEKGAADGKRRSGRPGAAPADPGVFLVRRAQYADYSWRRPTYS